MIKPGLTLIQGYSQGGHKFNIMMFRVVVEYQAFTTHPYSFIILITSILLTAYVLLHINTAYKYLLRSPS